MSFLWKLTKIAIGLCLVGLVLAVLGVGAAYFYVYRDLPKLDTIKDYRPPVISEVFDRDDVKVGEFWKERRIALPYKDIPKRMIEAMISSEDNRFFEHAGIDYLGILRAMVENFRAGHVVQGGSTITQQIVKSLLLTPERSYTRKIKEAILAKQIEEHFTKQEILYLYLTQTFFGNRAYGIEAAAENYFHKTLKEASLSEFAMLAGLPKAPTTFSPLNNPQRALERQWYVLGRMVEQGYISDKEATEAKATPLTLYTAGTDQDFNNLYAPWFTEHIRRILKEKYGDERLYSGGLKVTIPMDSAKEKFAEKAVRRGVRALDKRQGYKGPIGHVAESDIVKTCADFAEENFKQEAHPLILKGVQESSGAIKPVSSTTPYALREDTLYKAVITRVDAKAKELEVCHGDFVGTIDHDGYKWARARDLNTAGWPDADYVQNPDTRFKVGDIVYVALKTQAPAKDQAASANAALPSKLAFVLEQDPEIEGSLFSYTPATGEVLAMIGGYDFKEKEFDRAIQAVRQPGSSFKPFVYTSALLKGYKPDTVVYDSPITFEWGAGKFWSPKNYGNKYFGAIPLANALAHSLNTVAVRLIVDVGTDFVTALVRNLGLTTPIDRYYPMALGANDVHLFELTRAYGTFANGGILPTLIFIRRVEDRDGKLLEENKPVATPSFATYFPSHTDEPAQTTEGSTPPGAPQKETVPAATVPSTDAPSAQSAARNPVLTETPMYYDLENSTDTSDAKYFNPDLYQKGLDVMAKEGLDLKPYEQDLLFGREIPPGYVLNPHVATTMREMLMGVVDHGTAVRAKELKRPAAGKTGTTNGQTDAWFMGFVPQLVAGTWVGFDSRQSIGEKETGGKAALPIWVDYMDHALSGQDALPFVTPPESQAVFYDPTRIKAAFLALMRGEKAIDLELSDPLQGLEESPFVGDTSKMSRTPLGTTTPTSPLRLPASGPTQDDNFFSTDF